MGGYGAVGVCDVRVQEECEGKGEDGGGVFEFFGGIVRVR